LNFICRSIRSEGGLSGVHSCEAIDWSLLTASQVRIISVDTYRFGSSLVPFAADLHGFLERGGVIAWGMVPTLDDPFAETAASLHRRLTDLWKEIFPHRPSRETLIRQSLISPACGTGLLSEAQAVRAYALAAELSHRLRAG